MDLPFLPPLWQELAARLAFCLHRRHARRLAVLLRGALFAKGRRAVTSWLRAACVGPGFAGYYFLAALGRRADPLAGLLLRRALPPLAPAGPLLFAVDDRPTRRYGPHVQRAGVYHNPTPGPTDQTFLYGHAWVTPAWVVTHPRWGALGLPLLARLYVRRKDMPRVPWRQGWSFRSKLELAGALVRRPGPPHGPGHARRGRRLLRQAAVPQGGRLRGHGRQPAAAGRGAAHLAGAAAARPPAPRPAAGVRAGPHQPGQARRAGSRLAGGARPPVRPGPGETRQDVPGDVAAGGGGDPGGARARGWLALFSTEVSLAPEEVLGIAADRFSIEQDFHDLKGVEGLGQQQRDIWANVGALHLSAWVHTLVGWWAWGQPQEALGDRAASPWDDPGRRPAPADRRKAMRRRCLGQGFQQPAEGQALRPKIQQFVGRVIHQAA
jgi:hypothetical protein